MTAAALPAACPAAAGAPAADPGMPPARRAAPAGAAAAAAAPCRAGAPGLAGRTARVAGASSQAGAGRSGGGGKLPGWRCCQPPCMAGWAGLEETRPGETPGCEPCLVRALAAGRDPAGTMRGSTGGSVGARVLNLKRHARAMEIRGTGGRQMPQPTCCRARGPQELPSLTCSRSASEKPSMLGDIKSPTAAAARGVPSPSPSQPPLLPPPALYPGLVLAAVG